VVGPAGWRGGALTGEEMRQLRGEARERRSELQDLRRDLDRQGVPVDQMRDIIAGLERIENGSALKSREELLKLQEDIMSRLKDFEFGLRRNLARDGQAAEKLYLTGSDQVPPAYRKIVEEYYRSLSSKKK
jgi:hypothetical protein